MTKPAAFAIALATLTIPARSTLHAQTPESVPFEVVTALFGSGGVEVFVGQLPDAMPFELPLPDGARIIGSTTDRYGRFLQIAVAIPGNRREAEEALRERMLGAGWTSMPDFNRPRGGFVSEMGASPGGFCTDDGFMYTTFFPGADETVIRIGYHQSGMRSPCSESRMQTPMDIAPMPTLSIPEDATSRNSHSGMSEGSVDFGTIVETAQSVESLVIHFAAQLTEQGWTGLPPLLGDGLAMQRWDLRDASWQGYLTAVRLSDGTYAMRFGMVDMDNLR